MVFTLDDFRALLRFSIRRFSNTQIELIKVFYQLQMHIFFLSYGFWMAKVVYTMHTTQNIQTAADSVSKNTQIYACICRPIQMLFVRRRESFSRASVSHSSHRVVCMYEHSCTNCTRNKPTTDDALAIAHTYTYTHKARCAGC